MPNKGRFGLFWISLLVLAVILVPFALFAGAMLLPGAAMFLTRRRSH